VATAAAFEGCRGVIHTSALLGDRAGMADQIRVNVRGTLHVLDAAQAAGVERVVHLSSVATWGYDFTRDLPSEDARPRVCGAPYVDTKTASQELALRRGAAVVRPGDVYGPRSNPWTVRPVESLIAGTFVLPGKGDGIMTLVYIDDLVDCIVRALVTVQAAGRAVTAWDGVPVTAKEFFGHYARMLGQDEVRTLPAPVVNVAAALMELRARAAGTQPEVTREAIRYISRRAVYPNDRAKELLGWEPRIDLDEGMRRTEAWLRSEGLLSSRTLA
jgi:2-alkyl-3-oxoalkanoate reductase